jgi:hypothetical protein
LGSDKGAKNSRRFFESEREIRTLNVLNMLMAFQPGLGGCGGPDRRRRRFRAAPSRRRSLPFSNLRMEFPHLRGGRKASVYHPNKGRSCIGS